MFIKQLITLTASVLLARAEIQIDDKEADFDTTFGLYRNEEYFLNLQADDEMDGVATGDFEPAPSYDLLKFLKRHQKFERPPYRLEKELAEDEVRDQWERDSECYYDQANCNREIDYQPVIGILTQPVSQSKRGGFDYDSYVLEVNDNFIRWSGSRTVAIPYDIPQKELLELLPQINGVLLTGGALELVTPEGQQHPYYVTAKRIFHYSKFMKDVKSEDWPVIGICQGHEIVSIILGEDKIDTLDDVVIYGKNRPVEWVVDPQETKTFRTFPKALTDRMATQDYAKHAHSYSISMDTYEKTPGLKSFMTVTSVDTLLPQNVTFIDSMEAKNYPIYTTMYHPEYQLLDFGGPKKWKLATGDDTDEIAFRLSLLVNRDARSNSNRIQGDAKQQIQFMKKFGVSRVPAQAYPMIAGLDVWAYGYRKSTNTTQ